ncbi:unnamed protein product [Peronospora destructor]|uniref:Uncharacterized protein n=1 Tax=Peronospora destructor TaxID=86335 RepID=A0AAV0VEL7_9STRA|nr:unnamed protein product [Peronospora destructor]
MTTSQSSNLSHRAKNEQCCYIEFFTPTQEGFRLSFCTLDAADVLAGKAPSDRVIPLHPISEVSADWKRYFVNEIIDSNGQYLVEYGKHY